VFQVIPRYLTAVNNSSVGRIISRGRNKPRGIRSTRL